MLTLAFVGDASKYNTVSGNFLPPPPLEPDPPRWWGTRRVFYFSILADLALLFMGWLDPTIPTFRWLAMFPTGIAAIVCLVKAEYLFKLEEHFPSMRPMTDETFTQGCLLGGVTVAVFCFVGLTFVI